MVKSKTSLVKNTKGASPDMQQLSAMGAANAIPPQVFLYLIGVPLIIGGAYFILIKPLMKQIGAQTDAAKAADKLNDKVKSQPYWTGAYYKSFGGNTLKTHQAAEFATRLYNCMHAWDSWATPFGWGTDEACISGIFNLLGSKGNISMVSEQYSLMYNNDLYADMESEMAPEDLFAVTQKISQYAI
jgi:hypothetical protein|tara:strand:+ start:337 stop:894 length:558 start_codon:yes stop_codon:yes gene_type:complete